MSAQNFKIHVQREREREREIHLNTGSTILGNCVVVPWIVFMTSEESSPTFRVSFFAYIMDSICKNKIHYKGN